MWLGYYVGLVCQHLCLFISHAVLIAISVAYFEARKCSASNFVFVSQNHSGYSGSFMVPYKLRIFVAIPIKSFKVSLVGATMNLYIAFGSVNI